MDQWHVEVCYWSLYLFACLCPFNRWGWTQYVFGLSVTVCVYVCASVFAQRHSLKLPLTSTIENFILQSDCSKLSLCVLSSAHLRT